MGVVHIDTLFDRGRVIGVGQVAGLGMIHHPHPVGVHLVAAGILAQVSRALGDGGFALFAPDIAVVHIVIVGNGDAGYMPKHIAVRPAELLPFAHVVKYGAIEGGIFHAEATGSFIELITQKQRGIYIVVQDIIP